MTTAADYTKLITSEHADKPNFVAMVSLVAGGFADLQNTLNSLPAAFDVDEAVGVQLDATGAWVGLNRNLQATTPGLYVQAPDPSVLPLEDGDFRILLRGKIGANQWLGTIDDAYDKLTYIFGDTGSQMFMVDNQDMSMTVGVSGNVPSAGFKAALSGGFMQVRPGGVKAKYWFPTAPGGPLFGFGADNEFIGGFGHGVWASQT